MPVTVPGSGSNAAVTIASGTGDTLNVSQELSNALNMLGSSLNTTVNTLSGSFTVPSAPTVSSGTQSSVILSGSSSINATVPAGYNYVVDNSAGQSTISGSNIAVVGHELGGTYNVSGSSTVAATGGNNNINATGSFKMSAASGNDAMRGTGTGTIAGGAGTNTLVGSGDIKIISGGTNDFVVGQAGSNDVTSSGSNAGILGGTGTLTAAISGGGTTISAGSANTSVTTTGSSGVLFGGSGSTLGALNVNDGGSGNTVASFGSNASVNAGGSKGLVFGGSGTLNATIGGSANTLVGGTGASTVNATGSALLFGGTGAIQFVGGAGAFTLIGATGGSEQITVGSGGGLFSAGANNNSTIVGGTGATTIFGGSGSVVNFVSSLAGAFLIGADGNETLNASGSSAGNTFSNGLSSDANIRAIGGSGADFLFAGAGNSTLTGGSGVDTFVFFNSSTFGKANIITDFNTASDILVLGGYGQDASTVQLAQQQTPSGVVLTLSDQTTITFSNLTNANQLNGRIIAS